MTEESRRLVPLGDSQEYRVSSGLPDVRGWDVVGGDGSVLGRVTELMVDRDAGRVRYLELETPASPGGEPGRRLHLPIGLARIDEQRDVVLVPTVTTTALAALTTVSRGTITRDYEVHVRRSIVGADPSEAGEAEEAGFYESEHYDERHFVAPRRRPAGDETAGDAATDEDDENFGYLAGVGGAMTSDDEHPDVVGELGAGQISIPLMEEHTDAEVAPEGAELADPPPDAAELRRDDL